MAVSASTASLVSVRPSAGQVQQWLTDWIDGSHSTDLLNYSPEAWNEIRAGRADRFMWLVDELVRLGRIRMGHRVLDVGCGFGLESAAVSMRGQCHVVAADIRPMMTRVVQQRADDLASRGVPLSMSTITGDICAASMEAGSFDAILCNQTVEHVHDLERMFRACHRLLKPGGRMVITNDNNAVNTKKLAETREMWHRRDRSWDYVNELRANRPEENRNDEPYAVTRERIVRAANPKLDDPTVAKIVAATAGMIEPEIQVVAENYAPGDALPTPDPLAWCRNPVTGEYCERQLDPYALVRMLEREGFRARLRHGFRKAPLSLFNGNGIRPLQRMLFNVRPFFILDAERMPATPPAPVEKAVSAKVESKQAAVRA